MEADAATLPHPLAPEDRARADFYALLARLWADAPDAALLRAIAAAPPLGTAEPSAAAVDDDGGPTLPAAWEALRAASAATDPEAVADEYTDLFIGVGESEVNLHGSLWIAGHMNDRPLVELRTTLAGLGLAQRPDAPMLEDHLSAVCETMRILIAGGLGREPAPLRIQQAFFEDHLASWVFACCNAIKNCSVANYYVRVAQLTERFMAIERDAFAID